MNILLYGVNAFTKGMFLKLLNRVKDYYVLQNVVFVDADDHGEKNDSFFPLSYRYCHSNLFSAPGKFPNYSKYKFFDECLPVDEDLLKEMEPYEGEFMKILDRRNLRSYEERWRVYLEHLRYWNTALDRWEIDCYIHTTIPHTEEDYIIYALCQIKHIKFIGMTFGFFPGQFYAITDIYCQFDELRKEVLKIQESSEGKDIILSGMAKKYYELAIADYKGACADGVGLKSAKGLLANSWAPSYWSLLRNRLRFIRFFLRYFFSTEIKWFQWRRTQADSDIFQENVILEKYYSAHVQRREKEDKYIYVPLNVQPESSTSPCGGRYADLILYVELLSYYLPEGWWLYVKEHPVMHTDFRYHTNSRSDIFYERLLKLKNVKLMSMEESSFDLIDNAKAISIINGSAGMEGYLRKKPVLVFGHMFLEVAPKVYVVRNGEDCRRAMDKIVREVDSITDYDIKVLLKAMFSERIMIHGTTVPEFVDEGLCMDEHENNMAKGYFEKLKELFLE